MLYCGSTRLTVARAQKDKDTSEQQLNKNIRNWFKKNWKLSMKMCADLNKNKFPFQFQVQNNAYKWCN